MVTRYVTTDSIGTGTRYLLGGVDDLFIGASATVASEDTVAVHIIGHDNLVDVRGTVVGNVGGIVSSNGMGAANPVVRVHAGAVVASMNYSAVDLNGPGGTVLNAGEITGDDVGVEMYFSGRAVVTNDGLISGRYGVMLSAEMTGDHVATITNRGTIVGTEDAIYASQNVDRVINRGTIDGDIRLFSGADLYDGRRGEVIEGTVFGGAGNDTFLAGDGEDIFDGGAGEIDTLDFRSSGGLRVSLLDDSGTGVATGDTYVGFERILGSRAGADVLIGDHVGNTLMGYGGIDRLYGNGGSDVLDGGDGADKLYGGTGDDVFVFRALAEAGDGIGDFGAVAGNDDAFRLVASGFGGGLVAGALAASQFVTRTDNLAQDADDRFVFRTTDRTLWFDADGNGAGAAVMIADLQSGAVVTAADILLV